MLLRVAECGSMTLAAQQVNLTPAAVSAGVQRVESALGVRLFERTTRTLHPTEEGRAILDGCEAVTARWQQAVQAAHGGALEVEGAVRLAAPADTTYGGLEAAVLEACDAHPALQVVFEVGDSVQHVLRAGIDLAVRYGALEDSGLIARRLARAPGVLVASPAYLAERGAPRSPAALREHRCLTLQLAGAPLSTWTLQRAGQTQAVPLPVPLCGDGYQARRWAVQGRGVALKSLLDVIDDLEAGRLRRVLPAWSGPEMPVHAVLPSRRFQPARVRVVDEAVRAYFAGRAARCEAWLAAGG